MVGTSDTREKVSLLYQYIKQFCMLRNKVITDIRNQKEFFYFDDFPNAPEFITINYRDRLENISEEEIYKNPILTIKKPEFQVCPKPPSELIEYLDLGWEEHINDAILNEKFKNLDTTISNLILNSFNKWSVIRKTWVEKQKLIKKVRDLFDKLRIISDDLKKEDDTLELVVGNGILTKNNDKNINHPVLLKRVNIIYDAKTNSISIIDVDKDSELYLDLLRTVDGINIDEIRGLQEDVKNNFYHPLDRNDTRDFFKILIHKLHNNGIYDDGNEIRYMPNEEVMLISFKPVLILRKRNDGTLKALDSIIEDIETENKIPPYLIDLTNGGKIDIPEDNQIQSIDRQLAATSGEDVDILLPLEANKEQLEIAQRIEKFNAVIVQGPPGTGKSHSIANILSHFLAQGKNVLITSYTKKALSVLKDKIPKELQSLCVSLLDDSNNDMERSIEGIANYLSKYTSRELLEKAKQLENERNSIIKNLADLRKEIFVLRNQEIQKIVYDGKGYSVIDVADFVRTNEKSLATIIPGDVKSGLEFPLTDEELNKLYISNVELTKQDEYEIGYNLPNPNNLLSPSKFNELKIKHDNIFQKIKDTANQLSLKLKIKSNKIISTGKRAEVVLIDNVSPQVINTLKNDVNRQGKLDKWGIQAISDGLSHKRDRWLLLVEKIEETITFAQKYSLQGFGKQVNVDKTLDTGTILPILEELKGLLLKKKKLSNLDYLFHSDFKMLMQKITINGKSIKNSEDCSIVINKLKLDKMRKDVSIYWDLLLATNGQKRFIELGEEPEITAQKYIPKIKYYLDWYNNDYKKLKTYLEQSGFNYQNMIQVDDLTSNKEQINQVIDFMFNKLPKYINLAIYINNLKPIQQVRYKNISLLSDNNRDKSSICFNLIKFIRSFDCEKYSQYYFILSSLYKKIELAKTRQNLLQKLEQVAPLWASEIKNRSGIHGENKYPTQIKNAWKWKQFNMIIENITCESLDEKLKKTSELSKYLKQKTSQLAERKAWYHLLKRSEADLDLRQALEGWQGSVNQIGYGKGKNVKQSRQEARNKMKQCQAAVPAWIMDINTALENFTPGKNLFDVIIIDEASQADIRALSICYMGKKLIIVGDNKQVSPSSIGIEVDQTNNLLTTYLKGKIPNWDLYNQVSSLYDIAKTTFQPLMLREHFRCVPDIIGYSNKLSYNFKIKPLREAGSSNILPAVINYRVDGGSRKQNSKTNEAEAEAIVSLIQACIEQPEYKNKTFGVISLLGDEQALLIQSKIHSMINISEYENRKILCGNASNFQGDERDVIFLSMVDSNEDNVPLNLKRDGRNDSTKQRYNVAASRARDQMWIIHSLDKDKDLKDGDIRKGLLEYALNPNSYSNLIEQAKIKSESPFEQEVYEYLIAKDYNIIQQWPVGSYRIDMVAQYNGHKVAIECDGERFHSGEEKIREDMERQTILERIGWKFIRIRGSEYYRNKTRTIESVIEQLKNLGIQPEKITNIDNSGHQTSALLDRVKTRASQIRNSWINKTEDKDFNH